MSESIIVPLDNPVVVPATTQKEFDALWISQIVIRTLPPTDQSGGGLVHIEYVPMSSQTFEILPQVQTISTDKLMQAAAEIPEVTQAMGAILLSIDPLRQWIAAQNNPPAPEPEPEPEPEPQ